MSGHIAVVAHLLRRSMNPSSRKCIEKRDLGQTRHFIYAHISQE